MHNISHFNEISPGTEVTLVAGDRNIQSASLEKTLIDFQMHSKGFHHLLTA